MLPQQLPMREQAFSNQTRIALKLAYLRNYIADSNQIFPDTKDHQVIFGRYF